MYDIIMRLYFRIGEGESLDYITVESRPLTPDELTPEAIAARVADALTSTAEHAGCAESDLTPVGRAEVEAFEMKLRLKKMFGDEGGGLLGALMAGFGGFGEDEDESDGDVDEGDPFHS